MPIIERPRNQPLDIRVARTLEVIHDGDRFSVSELARNVGLSASRLEHLVKEQTGRSLRTHLLQRRLQQAAALLEATHLRVSEVCYAVGFCHPANFSNQFRRAFGEPPTRYRRMRQQVDAIISRID